MSGSLGNFAFGVGSFGGIDGPGTTTGQGLRTWGRPKNPDGTKGPWTIVTTDPNGFNDGVYLTTLAQVLQLNLNESPFWSNYGIPAHQSVVTQVFPDYYVNWTQQQFAPYFASLIVSKVNAPDPTYNISVTTTQGYKLNYSIAVPQ